MLLQKFKNEYFQWILKFLMDVNGLFSRNEDGVTNVSVVHCETSSGVVNPIEDIGTAIKTFNKGTTFLESLSDNSFPRIISM